MWFTHAQNFSLFLKIKILTCCTSFYYKIFTFSEERITSSYFSRVSNPIFRRFSLFLFLRLRSLYRKLLSLLKGWLRRRRYIAPPCLSFRNKFRLIVFLSRLIFIKEIFIFFSFFCLRLFLIYFFIIVLISIVFHIIRLSFASLIRCTQLQ